MQGYADIAAGLEKVSEAKEAVDEAKGAVLREVSATVEQITAAVKQKKVQLAPAIQELRALRQQFQVRSVCTHWCRPGLLWRWCLNLLLSDFLV